MFNTVLLMLSKYNFWQLKITHYFLFLSNEPQVNLTSPLQQKHHPQMIWNSARGHGFTLQAHVFTPTVKLDL